MYLNIVGDSCARIRGGAEQPPPDILNDYRFCPLPLQQVLHEWRHIAGIHIPYSTAYTYHAGYTKDAIPWTARACASTASLSEPVRVVRQSTFAEACEASAHFAVPLSMPVSPSVHTASSSSSHLLIDSRPAIVVFSCEYIDETSSAC